MGIRRKHNFSMNFNIMEEIMNRESFTIQRKRRDVAEQYWNLVLPLDEIEELKWKRIVFPLAIFRMKNQEEYRIFIFSKRRFNRCYLSFIKKDGLC